MTPRFDGMYGCEVGGTITTGVALYCISCDNREVAMWSSRQEYPRLQELIDYWNEHAATPEHSDWDGVS